MEIANGETQIARSSLEKRFFEVSPEDADYHKVIFDAREKLENVWFLKCRVVCSQRGVLGKLAEMLILQRTGKIRCLEKRHKWEKGTTLGMSLRLLEITIFLLRLCRRHQEDGLTASTFGFYVDNSAERPRSGGSNFVDSHMSGLHSKGSRS